MRLHPLVSAYCARRFDPAFLSWEIGFALTANCLPTFCAHSLANPLRFA